VTNSGEDSAADGGDSVRLASTSGLLGLDWKGASRESTVALRLDTAACRKGAVGHGCVDACSGELLGTHGNGEEERGRRSRERGRRAGRALACAWRAEGGRGGLGGSAAVGMLATARAACSGVGEEDDRRGGWAGPRPRRWASLVGDR